MYFFVPCLLRDSENDENCSLRRLNDAFRKTLLKAAKKTLRQPTINESRIQSNTRADFKLTYRENYGKL